MTGRYMERKFNNKDDYSISKSYIRSKKGVLLRAEVRGGRKTWQVLPRDLGGDN